MPVQLVLNGDGSLRQLNAGEIAALQLKRRGIRSEHDHWMGQFGPDGNSCTRRYSCAWDQRFQALLHFVGASKLYTDAGDLKLSRMRPQTDPDNPTWIATKVEISPWRFRENLDLDDVAHPEDPLEVEAENPGYQAGTHTPIFDRAELKVTFELSPWDVASDLEVIDETQRYVTWPGYPGTDISTQADYIGLPGGSTALQYTTATGAGLPAGKPIPFPTGFVEGKSTFKIIWRRVPFDAWGPSATLTQRVLGTAADRGMIGSINKTSFRGYAPLTLQLLGVEQRLLPDPTGLGYSWDIGYVLSNKPTPFGHVGIYFFDPSAGASASGYYQVQTPAGTTTTKAPSSIGDKDSLFIVREFTELFVVGEV